MGLNSCKIGHAARDRFYGDAELPGEFLLLLLGLRQKFVEGRVEQADGCRQPVEGAEDPGEILLLVGEQLGHRGLARFLGRREDHLAHRVDAVTFKEHMLGAAKADALGAEGHRVGDLVRLIRIGANLQLAQFVRPIHELSEVAVGRAVGTVEGFIDQHLDDFRGRGFHLAGEDLAAGAVDGKEVALAEDARADGEGALVVIDVEHARAADADLAHLAGDQRRMGADAAARSENAFRREHAANVLGRSLLADEQHIALGRFRLGFVGVKINAARRRARTRR